MTRGRHYGFGLITAEQAAGIRQRHDAAQAWYRRHYPRFAKRGGAVPVDPAAPARPTNEELSELELFEFVRDRPDRYFAYYDDDMKQVTTWMGQKLGDIIYKGPVYRTGWWPGARKQRVRVRAVTGDTYAGPCELDAGTYCRLRRMKGTR